MSYEHLSSIAFSTGTVAGRRAINEALNRDGHASYGNSHLAACGAWTNGRMQTASDTEAPTCPVCAVLWDGILECRESLTPSDTE